MALLALSCSHLGAIADGTIPMGVVPVSGTVVLIYAGSVTVAGDSESEVDIMFNKGSTPLLASAIVLDENNSNGIGEKGTLHATESNIQVSAGDVINVVVSNETGDSEPEDSAFTVLIQTED